MNRSKNNATFFYFHFFTFFRKKCITLAYFLEIVSKLEIRQGFIRRTPLVVSNLVLSEILRFTMLFWKASRKTQLHSFKICNLEKRHFQGSSSCNLARLFSWYFVEFSDLKITKIFIFYKKTFTLELLQKYEVVIHSIFWKKTE